MIMSRVTTVNNTTVLTAVLAIKVKDYFAVKENRAAFEDWYERKYGKKYVWKQK